MAVGRTREETVIRRLIEDWAAAVRARRIGAVVARHTDDVVMFDVPPPVVVRGIAAYRRTWPPFFRWQRDENGRFDIVKLNITAGDTVAFATAVLRCGSKAELAKDDRPRLRLTIGLRKVDGTWKIAHEHHSFPADE
jgi:ketosteroid isomerase-like protein